MQEIRKAGEQSHPEDNHQEAAITSEEEFERWLIAALEWERQRLQGLDALGSRSECSQQ